VTAGANASERNRRLGIRQVVEDPLTVFEKSLPFEGQRQLARRAQQQLDAKARLEGIEPAPDHCRRDAFDLCRRRQAAARRRVDEGLDLLDMVHRRRFDTRSKR
jgi:hypothetical protein